MKPLITFILSLSIIFLSFKKEGTDTAFVKENFSIADKQFQAMLKEMGTDGMAFPRTIDKEGKMVTTNMYDWTSGFFPGSLWYMYEYTGNQLYKDAAINWTEKLEPLKNFTRHHDLGFMMYCSYGNAFRLTGKQAYKEILIQSAKSLSTRFNPTTGTIKSWNEFKSWHGDKSYYFPVIIDNMMNLELLFFASKVTGDTSFRHIAITHALNTMKNQIRKDYSSYHVVCYDSLTGKVEARETAQGYADNSTWSRGHAWGIYGFTQCYRETGDERFLKTAMGMADYYLNHKNLPGDKIPLWDFNSNQAEYVPGVKSKTGLTKEKYRDASAAAIVASALLELREYGDNKGQAYEDAAVQILRTLGSEMYRAKVGANGNFLLMHSVGSIPHGGEIDVPLVYGDYYFLEGLKRYDKLLKNKAAAPSKELELLSPDGKINLKLSVSNKIWYNVNFNGEEIIGRSAMAPGFLLSGDFTVKISKQRTVSNIINLQFSDADKLKENYNELVVDLVKDGKAYAVMLRAYNEGIAFRTGFPNTKNSYAQEGTEFNFVKNGNIYQQDTSAFTDAVESRYTVRPVTSMIGSAELPLTVEGGSWFACINEAANTAFSRSRLVHSDTKSSGLTLSLHSPVKFAQSKIETPWRYILLSKTATGLIEKKNIIYSLAPPNLSNNTSWIKPGKAMREVTLTTEGALKVIDFCKATNLQYLLFDAGWYGKGYGMDKEHDPLSNARSVVKTIDMPKVIAYGKSKGIGVILYVNFVAMRQYFDELLPLYKSWGIAGLKFGFVDGKTQEGIKFIYEAVQKAAKHELLVDIHDNFRPTGMSRTYPNLLTQEGIRGNEHFPDATHNAVLPFTRGLTGAADYTIVYPASTSANTPNTDTTQRTKIKRLTNTAAHQLAMSVVSFSPLQLLFWYGTPDMYDSKNAGETFFKALPTVWDESKIISGQVGQTITVARRRGTGWYVGTIAGKDGYSSLLPLSFLQKGISYTATFFDDDGKGGVTKTTRQLSSTDALSFRLLPSGGQAVIFQPTTSTAASTSGNTKAAIINNILNHIPLTIDTTLTAEYRQSKKKFLKAGSLTVPNHSTIGLAPRWATTPKKEAWH